MVDLVIRLALRFDHYLLHVKIIWPLARSLLPDTLINIARNSLGIRTSGIDFLAGQRISGNTRVRGAFHPGLAQVFPNLDTSLSPGG